MKSAGESRDVLSVQRATVVTTAAVECEAAILGHMLLHPEMIATVRAIGLRPDQLWRRDHQKILECLFAMHGDGVDIDVPLINRRLAVPLDGGVAYLCSLSDSGRLVGSENLKSHVREVQIAWAANRQRFLVDRYREQLSADPSVAVNGGPAALAEKLDAVRWQIGVSLDARVSHTVEELLLTRASAPLREPLVGDLLAAGETAMLHGQPRELKTWAALEFALSLSTGTPSFGLGRLVVPTSRPVLYISNEDPGVLVADRLQRLARGKRVAVPDCLRLIVHEGVDLDDAMWRERLMREVDAVGATLTIIDPVRSVTAAVDQGPHEFRPFAMYLRRLIHETGTTTMLVHHDTKPTAVSRPRRRPQMASGGGLFAAVDAPIHCERVAEGCTRLVPDGYKHSQDPVPLTIRLLTDGENGPVRLIGEDARKPESRKEALRAAILDFVREQPGAATRRVATGVRRNRDDVGDMLHQLEQEGTVSSLRRGRARLWRLADVKAES